MNCQDINSLSYTDFISLLKEENRPSGGKASIRTIAQNAFITEGKKVLEVGCTNGFSSIEIQRLTGCEVVGIDINENSVNNANKRVQEYKLNKDKISFVVASADNIPFEDNIFDLIICGNALSFIDNKEEAMKEMIRVLKPSGFLSMIPIWYYEEPRMEVIKKVSDVLGFDIRCTKEFDWLEFPKKNGLELYFYETYSFDNKNENDVDEYINSFFSQKPELNKLDDKIVYEIKKRWKKIILVFNENLQLTAYSIMLMRKNIVEEEVEMFTAHRRNNG